LPTALTLLPFWNDTAPKHAIVAFIAKVTKEGSPDVVSPAERIATWTFESAAAALMI
jgi:hypothetical protein